MADDTPNAHPDGDDLDNLEVTNLRPRSAPDRDERRTPRKARGRRLAIGLSLVALVAVLLGSQPFIRSPLQEMVNTALSPTPLPTATARPTATPLVSVLSTPVAPIAMATALPGVFGAPALESAPSDCGGEPPALTPGGPPFNAAAIGHAPVLLGGFVSSYATLRLGSGAAANAYDWGTPYTQYGWPAPIGLILRSDVTGPVTLSGRDLRTGYPLWFGFIEAGVWGAPTKIMPTYLLDPVNPPVPAGGATGTEQFWYGYIFLPGAGCYSVSASWPGGDWQATVSAGR